MTRVPGCKSPANRLLRVAITAALLIGVQGCKAKPSEEACKDAINNIRRIAGQDSSDMGADPVAAIRSCRGNSSKESVECMRLAKTIEDLNVCEGDLGGNALKDPVKATDEQSKPPVDEPKADQSDAGASAEPPVPTPEDRLQIHPPTANPFVENDAGPGAEKPAAEKPAAEKPAAEKPAAEKPAAEKPAAEKPAAEKPAAQKPAAENPAAEKPAAEKPAAP